MHPRATGHTQKRTQVLWILNMIQEEHQSIRIRLFRRDQNLFQTHVRVAAHLCRNALVISAVATIRQPDGLHKIDRDIRGLRQTRNHRGLIGVRACLEHENALDEPTSREERLMHRLLAEEHILLGAAGF